MLSIGEDEHHLKVDGLKGIDDSSVVMISCHLEGQSGSDHIQRVGAYHRRHPWQHATPGLWQSGSAPAWFTVIGHNI